jgi:hypothetical protein
VERTAGGEWRGYPSRCSARRSKLRRACDIHRSTMSSKPWKKFSVGRLRRPDRDELDCQRLHSVAHVTHVPTALRIVDDAKLRADLVFDKSRLNTERIRVVWLSPNDWSGAGGFRYGNIRFSFDWATLVDQKQYYWVESIAYGIEACRILITDVDYSSSLDTYDPTTGDGPWWLAPSGEHYWNGNYCLEIMFEGDLELSLATNVDFVKHHSNQCNINHRTCRSRDFSADKAGAEFVAALVSRKPSIALPGLLAKNSKGTTPSWALQGAADTLFRRCRKSSVTSWGSLASTDPGASALARAALGALGHTDIGADFHSLAAHFKNSGEFEEAVANTLAQAFGLPNASALLT